MLIQSIVAEELTVVLVILLVSLDHPGSTVELDPGLGDITTVDAFDGLHLRVILSTSVSQASASELLVLSLSSVDNGPDI